MDRYRERRFHRNRKDRRHRYPDHRVSSHEYSLVRIIESIANAHDQGDHSHKYLPRHHQTNHRHYPHYSGLTPCPVHRHRQHHRHRHLPEGTCTMKNFISIGQTITIAIEFRDRCHISLSAKSIGHRHRRQDYWGRCLFGTRQHHLPIEIRITLQGLNQPTSCRRKGHRHRYQKAADRCQQDLISIGKTIAIAIGI